MIKNQLVNVPVKSGLIGSGLFMLMFVVTHYIGKNPLFDLKIFDFILIPIFLFAAMKEYKDFRNNGILHFWQGMTIGFLTFMIIGMLSGIFTFIVLEFVHPAFLSGYISYTSELFEMKKEEFIQQFSEQLYNESYALNLLTTSLKMGFDDFLKKAGIGFLLTIPIAVILRRREL